MSTIPQVLNLLHLAKGSAQTTQVPGTSLEVLMIRKPQELNLQNSAWLMVLEGELIIDLPFGDFRVLKHGDSLRLPEQMNIKLQPIKDTIVIWQN
jgi:hypothetical protein